MGESDVIKKMLFEGCMEVLRGGGSSCTQIASMISGSDVLDGWAVHRRYRWDEGL